MSLIATYFPRLTLPRRVISDRFVALGVRRGHSSISTICESMNVTVRFVLLQLVLAARSFASFKSQDRLVPWRELRRSVHLCAAAVHCSTGYLGRRVDQH